MSCLLHIDTATDVCSVALTNDGEVVCERVSDGSQPQHAALLAPYVEEMLSMADSHAMPLDGVAVSMGPGSYTGLRIGVSTAKGVCYARKVNLIAVPTLEMLCVPVQLGATTFLSYTLPHATATTSQPLTAQTIP